MGAIKGDFTGFTFNGIHSSELGLTRVSDGNRYTENLFPTIQDKTVQVPGRDGTYYFGSYYTQQPFNLSVVFDSITEEQFQKIKRVFGDKKIHDLIFDEAPYKIYKVKTTGTPNLKYICFNNEKDGFDRDHSNNKKYENKNQLYNIGARSPFGRIYKGEGQLNFICYTPFAKSRYKYLDEYTVQNIPEWGSMDTASANSVHYNLYDWIDSKQLKASTTSKTINNIIYQLDKVEQNGVLVYNPGDFPTYFNLYFLFNNNFPGCMISSPTSKNFDNYLVLDSFSLESGDIGIKLNGQLNLVEGIMEDLNSEQYIKIKNVSGKNPQEEGWYIFNENEYILTIDQIPQDGVIYFKRKIEYIPTGTIYNKYISGGDFFKIPNTSELILLPISPPSGGMPLIFDGLIEYDYIYY